MSKLRDMVKSITGNLGNPSLEAVSYQNHTKFFDALVSEIVRYRNEVPLKDMNEMSIAQYKFNDIIEKFTGMNSNFLLSSEMHENACVIPPQVDKNNRILHPLMAFRQGNMSVAKALGVADKLSAEVDRDLGRVSGFFSTVDIPIWITKGLLVNQDRHGAYKFTAEEVAAIILHEVGHAFSYIDSIARVYRRNIILESHLTEFCKPGQDRKQKIKLISYLKAEKILGDTFKNDEIADLPNDKATAVIIQGQSMHSLSKQDPNSLCYDSTSFEAAADQYAVRMGAGVHLASGLGKMYEKQYLGIWNRFVRFISFTFHLINLAWLTCNALLTFGLTEIVMRWMSNYIPIWTITQYIERSLNIYFSSYDQPKDRLERIRREIIGYFKSGKIDKDVQKRMLDQLDLITKQIKDSGIDNYDTSRVEYWMLRMFSFMRNNVSEKEKQQLREELINNSLYADAARFNTL